MTISRKDKERIRTLASEGTQISKIWGNDFPDNEYWEIYEVVYSRGGKSALGVKRTIANRLNSLGKSDKKKERAEIIEEIDDLVWHLYDNLKASQQKLEAIRKILDSKR